MTLPEDTPTNRYGAYTSDSGPGRNYANPYEGHLDPAEIGSDRKPLWRALLAMFGLRFGGS